MSRGLSPGHGLPGRGGSGRVGLPEAELVAVRVGAGREPAHARHRHRLVGLAPELGHARGARVDVVDAEVRARAALAGLHVGDRGALLVAEPGHVVLRRAGVRLELPAEQRAPELARLLRVVRRDLDVHNLAGHLGPPLASSYVSTLSTGRQRESHRTGFVSSEALAEPPPDVAVETMRSRLPASARRTRYEGRVAPEMSTQRAAPQRRQA